MANILSTNYNILSTVTNLLSAFASNNYLSATNPTGSGLLTIDSINATYITGLIDNYYTSGQVNKLIESVNKLRLEKVDSIEEVTISGILYLVPQENPEDQDHFDEYIYIDNHPEKIGNTKIKLENYYTKDETLSTFLTVTDPVGNGLFTFDGDLNISGNISSNNYYSINLDLAETLGLLQQEVSDLSTLASADITGNPYATLMDLNILSTEIQNNYVLNTTYETEKLTFALKTEIPEKTSQLINDSGFLQQHQSLDNYYTKVQTDDKISAYVSAAVSGLASPLSGSESVDITNNIVSVKISDESPIYITNQFSTKNGLNIHLADGLKVEPLNNATYLLVDYDSSTIHLNFDSKLAVNTETIQEKLIPGKYITIQDNIISLSGIETLTGTLTVDAVKSKQFLVEDKLYDKKDRQYIMSSMIQNGYLYIGNNDPIPSDSTPIAGKNGNLNTLLNVNIGLENETSGLLAFTHGKFNKAFGRYSTADGYAVYTNADCAHAEGNSTSGIGKYSHAEGFQTIATNLGSHAEGSETSAISMYAHAEGQETRAAGQVSHAEGLGTIAGGKQQHVEGRYNLVDWNNKYQHIVGNGTSNNNRKNIQTLDWDGNEWLSGNLSGNHIYSTATSTYLDFDLEILKAISGNSVTSALISDDNSTKLDVNLNYISSTIVYPELQFPEDYKFTITNIEEDDGPKDTTVFNAVKDRVLNKVFTYDQSFDPGYNHFIANQAWDQIFSFNTAYGTLNPTIDFDIPLSIGGSILTNFNKQNITLNEVTQQSLTDFIAYIKATHNDTEYYYKVYMHKNNDPEMIEIKDKVLLSGNLNNCQLSSLSYNNAKLDIDLNYTTEKIIYPELQFPNDYIYKITDITPNDSAAASHIGIITLKERFLNEQFLYETDTTYTWKNINNTGSIHYYYNNRIYADLSVGIEDIGNVCIYDKSISHSEIENQNTIILDGHIYCYSTQEEDKITLTLTKINDPEIIKINDKVLLSGIADQKYVTYNNPLFNNTISAQHIYSTETSTYLDTDLEILKTISGNAITSALISDDKLTKLDINLNYAKTIQETWSNVKYNVISFTSNNDQDSDIIAIKNNILNKQFIYDNEDQCWKINDTNYIASADWGIWGDIEHAYELRCTTPVSEMETAQTLVFSQNTYSDVPFSFTVARTVARQGTQYDKVLLSSIADQKYVTYENPLFNTNISANAFITNAGEECITKSEVDAKITALSSLVSGTFNASIYDTKISELIEIL